MGKGKTDLDLEWERRTLCSDGNCIGVIGSDGKCKECGKPYEGELSEMGSFEETVSDETETYEKDPEALMDTAVETDSDVDDDFDTEWENRQLCSDGNCIGVIGPDGKCKECGKPLEG